MGGGLFAAQQYGYLDGMLGAPPQDSKVLLLTEIAFRPQTCEHDLLRLRRFVAAEHIVDVVVR